MTDGDGTRDRTDSETTRDMTDGGTETGDREPGARASTGHGPGRVRDRGSAGEAEHDHHPATADWPRGFGEASWWPFLAALGAGGLYIGVGMLLLAQGDDPVVSATAGTAVALVGAVGLLAGLGGWVSHAFLGRVAPGVRGTSRSLWWGTVLFLATEFATFGAGFFYYFYIRAGPWPPGELPDLLTSLVLVNTAILLTSSLTLHVAHGAVRRSDRGKFTAYLVATVALGAVFLAGQAWEYYQLLVEEGYTVATGSYSSAFFGLTGLHGLHVAFGVLGLAVLAVRALSGEYSAEHHTSVTTVSLYWHFVDAVWIFLVMTLYIGATTTI